MNDFLLDIYFRKILEITRFIPPPISYKILNLSGNIFRNFNEYDPGMGIKGILRNAVKNIENAGVADYGKAKQIIKEYLKFESRFVLENIWLRKQYQRYILKSFHSRDMIMLDNMLKRQNYVIVSAHTSGLYAIVGLLQAIGYKSPFILMNMLKQPWDKASPLQRSVIITIPKWILHQDLFFVEDGNSVGRSQAAIYAGKSVVIAPDVPGYDRQGVTVTLLGKQIRTGAGAATIANRCGVPMLIAIPWASDCLKPYRIFLKIIMPSGNIASDMADVYQAMETAIRYSPACWSGWLYSDKMLAGNH